MRHAVDPRQKLLFDPAESVFSPMAIKYMQQGWPGLFRTQLLELMPVGKLAQKFHDRLGCPTKELYSMAGALFLKELFNLTIEQAVCRYVTDLSWHYALNVDPATASMSHATVERYTKLFVDNDLAAEIFDRVTTRLIESLELDLSHQRLDSTHIFSDMATFNRTKLMGVAIRRFLTQLKRHHRNAYDALPEDLRGRYAPSQGHLFGQFKGDKTQLRQTVAEDLLLLVNRFANDSNITSRTAYQAMERILHDQCEISEDKTAVTVKAKLAPNAMQNPSDADAGYDGHKGSGYQVQIAETCSRSNPQQLITGVEAEPAHCKDQDALVPMVQQLKTQERAPETLYADTHYGSDDNVQAAEAEGVDLQSPAGGNAPKEGNLSLDDFVIDPEGETVQCCPAGHKPRSSVHNAESGRTTTVMESSDCCACPFRTQCPVKPCGDHFVLYHTPAKRRLADRRAEQSTEAFEEHYSVRSGGESVNSGLKRRMGMGRLRTRGLPRVRMAVLLRCAGWNVLRALAVIKSRGKAACTASTGIFGGAIAGFWRGLDVLGAPLRPLGVPVGHFFVRWLPPSQSTAA